MPSWDMDPDLAVHDEGNTHYREGKNSENVQFYSLAISLISIELKFKTTALNCIEKWNKKC